MRLSNLIYKRFLKLIALNYLITGYLFLFFVFGLHAQYGVTNIQTLEGQKYKINTVKIGPRGLLVASASSEGIINIWDLQNGNIKFALKEHAFAVNAVDFNEDGHFLVSASDDGSVILWDMIDGANTADIEGLGEVTSVIFIDDYRIACGTREGYIYYLEWRRSSGKLRQVHKFENASSNKISGGVTALAFSKGRKVLFVGSEQGHVNLWDYQKRRLAEQNSMGDIINSIDLAQAEDKMTVGLDNGLLCSWDVMRYNSKITRMNKHDAHEYAVKGVHFIGTTTYSLSISTDGYLKIWNTEDVGQLTSEQYLFDTEDLPNALDISIKGDFAVVGGESGALKIFEIRQKIVLPPADQNLASNMTKKGQKVYTRKGKDYAVFFAVEDYDWGPLKNPISDAEALAQALNHKYNFDTTILRNPTKNQIRAKISELLNKEFHEEDQLLIYFSGHGTFKNYKNNSKDGKGYFLPLDAKKDKEDQYFDSYISYLEMMPDLNNIACKHILLIVDACYSGALLSIKGEGRYGGRPGEWSLRTKLIHDVMPYTTRLAITSGGKERTSDGKDHSPLTRKFLEGLASEGGKDKVLTFYELYGKTETIIPRPRQGYFGKNNPNSNFLFILEE